ncbi:MAG: THUMP domain-containing protein [Thaumarchaeota archaeon]|jgi:tRNA (guanine10-N2)-dimethyltransferase|nr:THUMP domain-containing protein [Candidatus Geocrenenecus arthurdayi]
MDEKHFFLLSGFDVELPFGEVKAVLSLLYPNHRIIKREGRILIVETSSNTAEEVVERTAYTKLSARLLSETITYERDILSSIDVSVIRDLIAPNSTIAVRGVTINGATVRKTDLERKIGSLIIENLPSLKVNLRKPDYTIIFVSSPEKTYIGILKKAKPSRYFYYRVAGRRPFTLPSAMQPDLSRCLVNLSRTKIGGRILDPFAGTGGIMIEAALLGYEVYGIELKRWIAMGALRNLRHYTPSLENIIVGDARKLMFRKCFNSIVTDPPYGRSTTIPDYILISLLETFFSESRECLEDDGTVTLVTPQEINIEDIASDMGYTLQESYKVRIHRSLIRKIMVFR